MPNKKILVSIFLAVTVSITFILASRVTNEIVFLDDELNTSPPPTNSNQSNLDNQLLLELRGSILETRNSLSSLEKNISSSHASTIDRIEKIEKIIEQLSSQYETTIEPTLRDDKTTQYLLPEETLRMQGMLAIERTLKFDEALEYEERDNTWADAMEETIALASQKELYSGSTFSNPSCKSTFCRIEAYHIDAKSRNNCELIRRELPTNSFHIQHFEEEEGGTSRSVIYFVRKGEEKNNTIFKTLNDAG